MWLNENEALFALGTAFGVDDDDAVGAAGSVDGRGRGVFQHVDRLDVGGVDRRGERSLGGESVDDVERGVALREGVVAADGDVGLGAQRTVARGDDHAGDTAVQSLVEVGDVGFHHGAQVGFGDRSREVAPRRGAVTDVDDLHGAQLSGLLVHLDVDGRAFADDLLDGRVAQIGEDQRLVLGDLDRVIAVDTGCRTRGRTLDHDIDTDQRSVVGVNHTSDYGVLCESLPGQQDRQGEQHGRSHSFQCFFHKYRQ